MRKLDSQLISLVVVIVLVSSMFALVVADYLAEFVFSGLAVEDEDVTILGLALKEVLMPLFVVIFSWIQMRVYSKSITAPISDLTKATQRIASGDFSTQITYSSKFKEIDTLQNNFNMMARELKNNEMLKRDFISNVSHEFKTPLSVIKGYADLLSEPDLPQSERVEYAAFISNEVNRLSNLTSNILRMSKLNNQEIIVSPKPFSLDEQVRQVVLLLMKKLSDKNIDISLNLQPVTVTGDEELLSQVWLNLLDNAIKYTNTNGKISITMESKPNGLVQTSISDTGIGMDEKTRCKIFDQFFQADSSHGKDGSGLGLSIVSRIVKLHRGSVSVQSKEGVGSVFNVVLPNKL